MTMKKTEIIITEIVLKDKNDVDTDHYDLEGFPSKDEVNEMIGQTVEIPLEDDVTLDDVEGIREIYISDVIGYEDVFIEHYEYEENK